MAKFRNEKAEIECTKKGSGADLYCPEDALSDNDEFDKMSSQNTSQSGEFSFIISRLLLNFICLLFVN